jgi:hypothetical protein
MRTDSIVTIYRALPLVLALTAGCGAVADDASRASQGDAGADVTAVVADDLEGVVHHVAPVATPRGIVESWAVARALQPRDGVTEADVDWASIVNLGKEIWAVVEANQPVVDISYDYATALPRGVTSAADLEGFSDLTSQSWRVWGENLYGMTVYDVTYTLVHQYGGAYQGKGRYLATVAVLPSNVDVLWGYKVSLNVTNVGALNVGSAEAPVGSVNLEMAFKVSTVIKSHTSTTLFQFRGDSADVNASDL